MIKSGKVKREVRLLTAGIDIGTENTKVVIVKDDKEIIARGSAVTGFDQKASAEEAISKALKQAGLSLTAINSFTATGAGRKVAPYATRKTTEIAASAKGVTFLLPSVRTVINVGSEGGRAIKCNAKGAVKDFTINEKCAAGAGTFVKAMARALEVSLEEFARMSLNSTKSISMNAQCVIFAESEVVSLIHAKTPREDVARAVFDSIADRIASMVRRVGIEKDIALIGGMAKSAGFAESLKRGLGMDLLIPEAPEYVTALGAALIHA